MSITIAASRYQTQLGQRGAEGKYRGLEPGADIFEGTNLDRVLLDDNALERFFETLLFKRMRSREDALSVFETKGEGRPDEYFVLAIFKNKRAF